MTAIESLGEIETPAGVLRCTLGAFENINVAFGSYGEGYRRVSMMDAGAMTTIVEHGAGLKFNEAKALVFKIGPRNLVGPLGKYLSMLSNGGKLSSDDGEDGGAGEA